MTKSTTRVSASSGKVMDQNIEAKPPATTAGRGAVKAAADDRGEDAAIKEMVDILRATRWPKAKEETIRLAIAYCKAGGFDPLQNIVHIVPMYDKESRGYRDVIMPGIDLYRIKAARTGQYIGKSAPEFGPMIKRQFGTGTDACTVEFPEFCRMTVMRLVAGQVAAFTVVERWTENYAESYGGAPNSMWRKRPHGQLQKVAEAQALRTAFPEVGGGYTFEEMDGKGLADLTPASEAGPEVRPQAEKPEAITKAKQQLDAFAGPAQTQSAGGGEAGGPAKGQDASGGAAVMADLSPDAAKQLADGVWGPALKELMSGIPDLASEARQAAVDRNKAVFIAAMEYSKLKRDNIVAWAKNTGVSIQ